MLRNFQVIGETSLQKKIYLASKRLEGEFLFSFESVNHLNLYKRANKNLTLNIFVAE